MTILFQKKFYTHDISSLLKLAIPLILSGLVESSIGFFSTIFLAHLGHKQLAAGSIVTWLFATLMVILWGSLTAISLLVSQKYGEKNNLGVSAILRDGLLLSLILVLPTFLLLWNMAPLLLLLGQSHEIVILATSYLRGLAFGLLPDFIMLVFLQFLIGLGHTKTTMTFILCWVPIAIFCNYGLVFGRFGFPRLEIAGLGWGMTLSYWITTAWLVLYVSTQKKYRFYIKNIFSKQPLLIKEILKIGIPMGAMYSIEIGFFLVLSLLMGRISNQVLAANQIALQYLGQLMSMIFALAQAVSVRMGQALGANNPLLAERTTYAGMTLAFSFIFLVALFIWIFPEKFISLDLNIADPQNTIVVHYATIFLMVSALFQLFECIRITLFGSLRALKDTHFTLFISIISFWLIALPLGYSLSYTILGSVGYWWGMVLGTSCSALLLWMRFKFKMKKYHLIHESPKK